MRSLVKIVFFLTTAPAIGKYCLIVGIVKNLFVFLKKRSDFFEEQLLNLSEMEFKKAFSLCMRAVVTV